MNIKNRILLYAHYDRDGLIDEYVYYILNKYSEFGIKIIFISNSPVNAKDKEKVLKFAEECIIRENKGYDFGAWKQILLSYGVDYFSKFDELILTNSSYYGPIFQLHELFDSMGKIECDFWGITKHTPTNVFPEHLQSYFMLLRKPLILSEIFWGFWSEIKDDIRDWIYYVVKAEIEFSKILKKNGFKYKAYIELKNPAKMPEIGFTESYSLNAADMMIEKYNIPFLKVKAFQHTPKRPFNISSFIIEAIKKSGSEYPLDLIINHQKRVTPISWQKNLPGTFKVISKKEIVNIQKKIKIGVFGHFYYEDMFDNLIFYLKNIPYLFDLYITSSCENLKNILENKIFSLLNNVNNLEIRVVENRGRDLAPWLIEFGKKQLNYDIALKIQTKKSNYAPEYFGYKWHNYLMESILASESYVSNIIKLFIDNPKLGIAFPTFPPIINMVTPHSYSDLNSEMKSMQNWLKRLDLNPPAETDQPVFPVGTMFWYRPKALRNLFECNISIDEFHKEPFPVKGTTAHGLERAIPYIVQGQGFNYKHIISEDLLINCFHMYEDNIMSDARFPERSRIYDIELGVKETIKLFYYAMCRFIRKHYRNIKNKIYSKTT